MNNECLEKTLLADCKEQQSHPTESRVELAAARGTQHVVSHGCRTNNHGSGAA